jgi:hypothetical protein
MSENDVSNKVIPFRPKKKPQAHQEFVGLRINPQLLHEGRIVATPSHVAQQKEAPLGGSLLKEKFQTLSDLHLRLRVLIEELETR